MTNERFADLEFALQDLGAHIAYPDAPNVASVVAARLRSEARRPQTGTWWRRLALAAACVVVGFGATVAVSPAAREAVADWLGVDGVRIVIEDTPRPTASPLATVGELSDLDLGDEVTLAQAQAEVDFDIVSPGDPLVGPPQHVFLDQRVAGGMVSLVYEARPGIPKADETGVGILLSQFVGETSPQFIKKISGVGTRVDAVAVSGAPGFFVHGEAHTLLFEDEDGVVREDRSRLAGNTLLWSSGGITFRLESALPKRLALALAESIPSP